MKVILEFLYGEAHVPTGRKDWPRELTKTVVQNGKSFTVGVRRPKTLSAHEGQDNSPTARVAHADIPILVQCELDDHILSFRRAANAAVEGAKPFVEALRVRTQQPSLRLYSMADLKAGKVNDLSSGKEIIDLTKEFKNWMDEEGGGWLLPSISKEDWGEVHNQFLNEPDSKVPLYESLLLDAQLEFKSDPKLGVIYSALACEVFIHDWLGQFSASDLRLQRWLKWADPNNQPEKYVSVSAYFDLGLFLATGRSLKENKFLWEKFDDLTRKARNRVVHSGVLPSKYDPLTAADVARDTISWVKSVSNKVS